MNLEEARYRKHALVHEMLQAPAIIRSFNPQAAAEISRHSRIFLAGEGSSRILPAKSAICRVRKRGLPYEVATDGGRQALEYDLSQHAVVALSNSGRTREIVDLLSQLKGGGCRASYSLSAHAGTPVMELADTAYLLSCGPEEAVGATKSIVEQALFINAIFEKPKGLQELGTAFDEILKRTIPAEIIDMLAAAETIYFAGRNNGVAEELTLKANEIIHKRADFLEGTYAVHGIEEVMRPSDLLILIEPFRQDLQKFSEVLLKGVGLKVIAIAGQETCFPTIIIPEVKEREYLQLACGWSLLVEGGLASGIDIDRPVRARKVGNSI